MATRPHIPDAWHADVHVTTSTGDIGTFGFSLIKGAAAFSLAELQPIADSFVGLWNTDSVQDAICDQVRLTGITWTSYDQPTRAQIFTPIDSLGQESGDCLPYNVAVITSFKTDLAGPAHRGRCYIPGFTEASADANNFNSTSAGNLAVFWADFVSSLSGLGITDLAVISKKHTSVEAVTSIQVEALFATQRRRLSRVRR